MLIGFVSKKKYNKLLEDYDFMVKKCAELEQQISQSESGRKCSQFCKSCEHGVKTGYNPFSGSYYYGCDLDVDCKDYKRKEE